MLFYYAKKFRSYHYSLLFFLEKDSELLYDIYEGEQNVAKRLLTDVVSVHKKLIDVVVYDALACNSVWMCDTLQYEKYCLNK